MLSTQLAKPKPIPDVTPLFDEDGYLLIQELWSQRLAVQIAEEEGVGPLTEQHWRVLHYVRDKFFRLGAFPNMRLLCRETALSKEDIRGLFGGCLVFWRIAGLPNPGEEVRAYLS